MKTLNKTQPFLFNADTRSAPGKLVVTLVQFETVELDMRDPMDMDQTHFATLDLHMPEMLKLAQLITRTG